MSNLKIKFPLGHKFKITQDGTDLIFEVDVININDIDVIETKLDNDPFWKSMITLNKKLSPLISPSKTPITQSSRISSSQQLRTSPVSMSMTQPLSNKIEIRNSIAPTFSYLESPTSSQLLSSRSPNRSPRNSPVSSVSPRIGPVSLKLPYPISASLTSSSSRLSQVNTDCVNYTLYMEPDIPLRTDTLQLMDWTGILSKYGTLNSISFKIGQDRDMILANYADQQSILNAYENLFDLDFTMDNSITFKLKLYK
jgi:hypothetical protein